MNPQVRRKLLQIVKMPATLVYVRDGNLKTERREVRTMSILKNKKVVIIGDRDGVPGEAIQPCVENAGGTVVFSSTECFV
jgi:betaine reductase